jgi:hypothetical protein
MSETFVLADDRIDRVIQWAPGGARGAVTIKVRVTRSAAGRVVGTFSQGRWAMDPNWADLRGLYIASPGGEFEVEFTDLTDWAYCKMEAF